MGMVVAAAPALLMVEATKAGLVLAPHKDWGPSFRNWSQLSTSEQFNEAKPKRKRLRDHYSPISSQSLSLARTGLANYGFPVGLLPAATVLWYSVDQSSSNFSVELGDM